MRDYLINGSIIAIEGFSPLAYKALGIEEVVTNLLRKYCGSYDSKYYEDVKRTTYSRKAEDNSITQPYIDVFNEPEKLEFCFNEGRMEQMIKKGIGISHQSALILQIRSDYLIGVNDRFINARETLFDSHFIAKEIFDASMILIDILKEKKNKIGLRDIRKIRRIKNLRDLRDIRKTNLVLLFDDEEKIYTAREFRTAIMNLSLFKNRG